MTANPPTLTRADRFEGVMLVLILLAIGAVSAAASLTHIHDWTMANSPAGTGDWFGWANAVVSDLVPVGVGLEVRRRRRHNLGSGGAPGSEPGATEERGTAMNIKDLLARLTEIAEAYPNAEVMLAVQPGYPIAETLRGVADPDDELDLAEDLSDDALEALSEKPQVVWSSPAASRRAMTSARTRPGGSSG